MNVLITDCPTNTKERRTKMCEIMFEHFKVQKFSMINTATLSLFSTGTTTGLVAECGEGVTYTVPVFEGFALPHAIHRLDVSGQDITKRLFDEILCNEIKLKPDEHMEVVRKIKEQMCHVAENYESEVKYSGSRDPLDQEQRSYELPSGQIIEVNLKKRITAAEVMFNPKLAGGNNQLL